MRIMITDHNRIWKHNHPALEVCRDVLLVVCLGGEPVTDRYECFVTPYRGSSWVEGQTPFGVQDEKYAALESVSKELAGAVGYREDLIILADYAPESLYPFLALKDLLKDDPLHLCIVAPWSFAASRRPGDYGDMLYDLSSLNSLLYVSAERLLSELAPGSAERSFPEQFEMLPGLCMSLLPRILGGIRERNWSRAYFDLFTRRQTCWSPGDPACMLLHLPEQGHTAASG